MRPVCSDSRSSPAAEPPSHNSPSPASATARTCSAVGPWPSAAPCANTPKRRQSDGRCATPPPCSANHSPPSWSRSASSTALLRRVKARPGCDSETCTRARCGSTWCRPRPVPTQTPPSGSGSSALTGSAGRPPSATVNACRRPSAERCSAPRPLPIHSPPSGSGRSRITMPPSSSGTAVKRRPSARSSPSALPTHSPPSRSTASARMSSPLGASGVPARQRVRPDRSGDSRCRPLSNPPNHTAPSGVLAIAHTSCAAKSGRLAPLKRRKRWRWRSSITSPAPSVPIHSRPCASRCSACSALTGSDPGSRGSCRQTRTSRPS